MEQLIMKTIPGLGIIIVAGGSSSRYGQKNKLFENLGGLPVFLHSIKNFAPFAEKGSLILVIPQGQADSFKEQIEKYLPQTKVKLVSGGSCRTESVKNGLAALPPGTQIAAIHDAARPLADGRLLLDLVNTVQTGNCGAIAAEKMIDSVCRTDSENNITESVPRENLWRIQTPQIFPYRAICGAYRQLGDIELTDDSAAARACGIKVKVCCNTRPNPKLTLPGDLPLLSYLLKNASSEK